MATLLRIAKAQFLSTPSARRATFRRRFTCSGREYFYPRPPRGGRRLAGRHQRSTFANFYPRPPRGGRRHVYPDGHRWIRFLSTPSARRATHLVHLLDGGIDISIHALREEGDRPCRSRLHDHQRISIHALREEGDVQRHRSDADLPISIHALREEGDVILYGILSSSYVFLSTPSARRATCDTPCIF